MYDHCRLCNGHGHVTVKLRNLGGRSSNGMRDTASIVCPDCMGKGYVTPEDRARVKSVELYEQIVE